MAERLRSSRRFGWPRAAARVGALVTTAGLLVAPEPNVAIEAYLKQQRQDAAAMARIRFLPTGTSCGKYAAQPGLDPATLPDLLTRRGWVLSHNALRKHYDLQPLHEAPELNRTAQQTADYLAANSLFAHVSRKGQAGLTLITDKFSKGSSRRWEMVAENLGMGADWQLQSTRAAVFSCLTDSPTHRFNMLHDEFNAIGVGYADYQPGTDLFDGVKDQQATSQRAGVVVIHFAELE